MTGKKTGRPVLINDEDIIAIRSVTATSRLQQGSERRAMLNTIIDAGGKITMRELNELRGYECRSKIGQLVNHGWVAVERFL